MNAYSNWLNSCRTLLLLSAIAGLLLGITGCQSLTTGSGDSRESKYSLKKRKSYISCIPENGSTAVICHLPLKVAPRDLRQMFSSVSSSLGSPYRPGGSTPDGFDCSGLTAYLYKKQFRMLLPRTAGEQALLGPFVFKKELQQGDLVFFTISGSKIDHVGIFIGNGSFAHSAKRGVMINRLNENYYMQRYAGAARLVIAY
jgi:lipoprotein Spr